jgi:hypothetical protein
VAGHRDGQHADAVFLAQGEMAIVAGNRGNEGRMRPRGNGVGNALQQRPDNAVVHHREAGIVGDDDLPGRRTEGGGKQRACFGQTLQVAVVAGVLASLGDVVAIAGQGQHRLRQIKLVRCRFAASHVEFETTRSESIIVGAHLLAQGMEVGIWQIGDRGHGALGVAGRDLPRIVARVNHFRG